MSVFKILCSATTNQYGHDFMSTIKNTTAKALLLLVLMVGQLLGISGVHAADNIVYYHNDALGSPVAATDQTGNVLWQEEYKPYGKRLLKEANTSEASPWFTGKPEEESLGGIQYFGARWYHPDAGRFMGIDPVSSLEAENNPMMFNRYAYANNNPYIFVDPDGRDAVNVGITLSLFGEGVTNTISFRFPGASKEPIDVQLKVGLTPGIVTSKVIETADPGNPLAKSEGFMLAKGTLNVGYDFGASEESGTDVNMVTSAGAGMLGGTGTIQNVTTPNSPPIPSSFEVNVGPQLGAEITPEVEFTTSFRDLVRTIKNK